MREVARLQRHLREAEDLEAMLVSLLTDMASKTKMRENSDEDIRKWRALTQETIGKLKFAIDNKVREAERLAGGKKDEDGGYGDNWW